MKTKQERKDDVTNVVDLEAINMNLGCLTDNKHAP